MTKPGDKILEIDLKSSWEDVLSTFNLLIENGHKLRPLSILISYIIDKEYSNKLYAGSSLYTLLISLPKNGKINFTKTLRVEISQLTSTVSFSYHNQIPRPNKPEWEDECQLTEITDTFEYFIEIQNDWKQIIKNDTPTSPSTP